MCVLYTFYTIEKVESAHSNWTMEILLGSTELNSDAGLLSGGGTRYNSLEWLHIYWYPFYCIFIGAGSCAWLRRKNPTIRQMHIIGAVIIGEHLDGLNILFVWSSKFTLKNNVVFATYQLMLKVLWDVSVWEKWILMNQKHEAQCTGVKRITKYWTFYQVSWR